MADNEHPAAKFQEHFKVLHDTLADACAPALKKFVEDTGLMPQIVLTTHSLPGVTIETGKATFSAKVEIFLSGDTINGPEQTPAAGLH